MSKQENLTTEKPAGDHWLIENAKKQWLALVLAAVAGAYNFVGGSHDSLKDLDYKLQTQTTRIDKIEAGDAIRDDTQKNFLIAITKISEAQAGLAQKIGEIKDQQDKNTERLLNRK